MRGDLAAAETGRDRGLRRAARLRALHHRGRLLRDRRDPPPARGPACRRGGLRTSERAGSRPAARPCPAPPRGGEARCRGRGNHPRAPGGARPARRIRRLPAQVEIAVAARDLKTARAAAAELEQLVDSYKTGTRRAPAFDATVHVALGRIALAEDDTDEAVRRLRQARDDWREVGAPFECAQSRVLLGVAFRRRGEEHAATTELEAAHATFERIGAKADAERAPSSSAGNRPAARSCSRTSSARPGCSRRSATRNGGSCSNGTTWCSRSRSPTAAARSCSRRETASSPRSSTPRAALEAAVAIQRALEAEIVAPDVRIGAHTGDAFQNDGAANPYGGGAVHLAARIGASAGGGEILASHETVEGAGTGFRTSEPRPQAFKGFAEPVDVISVDWK